MQNVSREDFAAEFSEDLAVLQTDQKLPNSRLQQVMQCAFVSSCGKISADIVLKTYAIAYMKGFDLIHLFSLHKE